MKRIHRLSYICVCILAVETNGAAASLQKPPSTFAAQIDRLCSWTGLKRVGPIGKIEQWRGELKGWNVNVHLLVEGKVVPYEVQFDKMGFINFWPPDYECKSGVGTGYDTLKDSVIRQRCIQSVEKINAHLHWHLNGKPTIQQCKQGYRVSYSAISEKERAQPGVLFVDPFINFSVTANGTVFAISHGS